MKVLLDTHVFLWWIADDPRLSIRAKEVISNQENELLLSAGSGWEIAVKAQLGRLTLPYEADAFVLDQLRLNAISTLSIEMNHALRVCSLPNYHRDPFDKLLIAQANEERIPILSADPNFQKYQVEVIW